MSLARRRRLVEVARERELLVLEDNPYGLLRYEGEPLPTLYSLDAEAVGRGGASDLVIYLGTFSKILSPGLRLGWAVAPRPVLEKLNLGKQGADLCSSPVTQLFVAAYFAEREPKATGPAWIEYVERLKQLYRRRRDVMLEALEEHFGGRASWTRPQGGLFIWATLDGGVDTTDLLRAQRGRGVRAGPRRLHGRTPWSLLDALELRGRARRGHPRGNPADRQDHERRHGPAGNVDRIPARAFWSRRSRSCRSRTGRRWPTSSRCPAATLSPPVLHAGEGIDERRSQGGGAQGRGLSGARRCRCAPARGCRRR